MNLAEEELKLSRKRVQMGIDEMEFKILKIKLEIERLTAQVQISSEKVKELDVQILDITED